MRHFCNFDSTVRYQGESSIPLLQDAVIDHDAAVLHDLDARCGEF